MYKRYLFLRVGTHFASAQLSYQNAQTRENVVLLAWK